MSSNPIQPGKSTTILLVEDDPQVRALTRRVLERSGYTIIEARHGRHALELLTAQTAVDLLISDVVMPIMSGTQLAEVALGLRPGLKVLFISAHVEDPVVRELMKTAVFVQKPFTPEQLREAVRRALG
jgi:CheY-like chemotaxis protein